MQTKCDFLGFWLPIHSRQKSVGTKFEIRSRYSALVPVQNKQPLIDHWLLKNEYDGSNSDFAATAYFKVTTVGFLPTQSCSDFAG